jgi:hypothetical protein
MSDRDYLSIGEVLAQLLEEHRPPSARLQSAVVPREKSFIIFLHWDSNLRAGTV